MNYIPDESELNKQRFQFMESMRLEHETEYQKEKVQIEKDIENLEESCVHSIQRYYNTFGVLPKNTSQLVGCRTRYPLILRGQDERFKSEMYNKYGDKLTCYTEQYFNKYEHYIAINRDFKKQS